MHLLCAVTGPCEWGTSCRDALLIAIREREGWRVSQLFLSGLIYLSDFSHVSASCLPIGH